MEQLPQAEQQTAGQGADQIGNLAEEGVVHRVDAGGHEAAEGGDQQHIGVVEDDAGDLVDHGGGFLGDGLKIGGDMMHIQPAVVFADVEQQEADLQQGADGGKGLHQQDVGGEEQNDHLADVHKEQHAHLQVVQHIGLSLRLQQQAVLSLDQVAQHAGKPLQQHRQEDRGPGQGDLRKQAEGGGKQQHHHKIDDAGAPVVVAGGGHDRVDGVPVVPADGPVERLHRG